MKKLLLLGAVLCGFLITQNAYSQDTSRNYVNRPQNTNWQYDGRYDGPVAGDNQCCPEDHAVPDQPLNDCYCLYVHYEPCYYQTCRCVEEKIPCKKKCWRKVPRYYECQRCKMVPQYYNECVCKYENECYEVDDCKCCYKNVYDTHCKYTPKYYWKHSCGDNPCAQAQQSCPAGY